MTPAVHGDDNQKSLAVLEDLLKFLRTYRVGLFAHEEPMRIVIAEPHSSQPLPKGMKHSRQVAPLTRAQVQEWREIGCGQMLWGHVQLTIRETEKSERQRAVLDGIAQVLRNYDSALIPAPCYGKPMLVLCDGVPTNWRAYAIVSDLDCYGHSSLSPNELRVWMKASRAVN